MLDYTIFVRIYKKGNFMKTIRLLLASNIFMTFAW